MNDRPVHSLEASRPTTARAALERLRAWRARQPDTPAPRFSEVLAALAAQPSERVSIGDILSAFGDRSFGALLLVFAAPNALPMPPGVSAVLGAPLLFITAQLMIGRSSLWLPGFVCHRSMPRSTFAAVANKLVPILDRLERYLRCRLTALISAPAQRVIGAACLLLAIVLFLPIPFGNMLPGFAISAFALAIIEHDGAAAAIGWAGTSATVVIIALLWSAIAASFVALIS
jgi:hypothetical protein